MIVGTSVVIWSCVAVRITLYMILMQFPPIQESRFLKPSEETATWERIMTFPTILSSRLYYPIIEKRPFSNVDRFLFSNTLLIRIIYRMIFGKPLRPASGISITFPILVYGWTISDCCNTSIRIFQTLIMFVLPI